MHSPYCARVAETRRAEGFIGSPLVRQRLPLGKTARRRSCLAHALFGANAALLLKRKRSNRCAGSDGKQAAADSNGPVREFLVEFEL